MASAMVRRAPKRKGPPEAARQSFHMVSIRSMSAWAPAQTGKPGWRALMFIGSAERRLAKPEWISPDTDRHHALALGSVGSREPPEVLVEVLADGQGVPDHEVVVAQPRHQERRRQQQELGPGVGIVAIDDLDGEVQPGELAQQPAPERPRAVVAAVDGECGLRHGCSSGTARDGCSGASREITSRQAFTPVGV